jgi:hypothetical protein
MILIERTQRGGDTVSLKYCGQNCLNQLDVNKQSLIRAHCSIVTVLYTTTWHASRLCIHYSQDVLKGPSATTMNDPLICTL